MQSVKLQFIFLILNLVWVPVSTYTYISGCEDAPIQCYESNDLFCLVSGNVTGLNQNTLYNCAQNSTYDHIQLKISSGGGGVTLKINITLPDNIKSFAIRNNSPEPVTVETVTVNMNVKRINVYGSEVYINQNDFFSHFQSLEYFYAYRIGSEGMPIFSNNINMETIDVNNATIRNETSRVITSEMIGGLPKLKSFRWRDSYVKEIRSDAFHGLTSLLKCDLRGNSIQQLHDCTFSDLVNLNTLDLSDNDIRTVGEYAFMGFKTNMYQEVYLNKNPSFPLNTLTLAKSITHLYLDGYNSSLINAQFLQQFPHLRDVYFGSTHFDCSCEYEWISRLKSYIDVRFGYQRFCTKNAGMQADDSSLYSNCNNNVTYQCFNHSIVCEGENWLRVDSGNNCLCTYPPERSLYNETSLVCSDIDECDDGSTVCQGNCTNTLGSYMCACGDGYVNANETTCDLNECETANGGCSQNCTNTIGSYACTCFEGYIFTDGTTCSDVNECMTANGGCSQNCTNNIGSHTCSCFGGYIFTDGTTCSDVNECETANGGCSQNCTNTNGSYVCTCSDGYDISLPNTSNCDLIFGGSTGRRIMNLSEIEFSIFVVSIIALILILLVTLSLILLCVYFQRRSRVPKLKSEPKPTLAQLDSMKAEKGLIMENSKQLHEVVPSEMKKVDEVVLESLAPKEGIKTLAHQEVTEP